MLRSYLTRGFSFSSPKQRLYSGLLSGFDNVSHIRNAQFYAKSLDLKSTADFLKMPSYVYEQAKKDLLLLDHSNIDAYLFQLNENKKAWMKSNNFHDRELILKSVLSVMNNEGQFACLLGGKSTGKTLLFDHLSKEENNEKNLSLVHLNMRKFPDGDILKALLTYLLNTKTEKTTQIVFKSFFSFISKKIDNFKDDLIVELAKVLKENIDVDIPSEFIEKFKDYKTVDLLNILRTNNVTDADVLSDLLYRLTVAFGNVTVVIDEANLALTPKVHDEARLDKAQKDLEVLTQLSKESKKVILLTLF